MDTYEKKYKESLALMVDCIPDEDGYVHVRPQDIFSELKESEDEKVREDIISLVNEFWERIGSINPEYSSRSRMLAWLEKQGEQKPSDKTEPKFKVGNWYQCTKDFFGKGVTFDKNTAYYCAKEGCLQNEYGCHIAIVKDLYDNFKLWTIQDAKDGDVLANCNIICIYKKRESEHLIKVYLNYSLAEGVEVTDATIGDFNLYPATKKQRDLFFQKMKEAGYEWDAEKKELKKVEKKSQRMISAEAKEAMYDKPTDEDMKEALRTEYEKGRADAFAQMQKEWSEEDEQMILSIKQVMSCASLLNIVPEKIDKIKFWLKSLKERIGGKL